MEYCFVSSFTSHPELINFVRYFQHQGTTIRYHLQQDKLTIEGTVFAWNWDRYFQAGVRALKIQVEEELKKKKK
jgi:hypothetical protein